MFLRVVPPLELLIRLKRKEDFRKQGPNQVCSKYPEYRNPYEINIKEHQNYYGAVIAKHFTLFPFLNYRIYWGYLAPFHCINRLFGMQMNSL